MPQAVTIRPAEPGEVAALWALCFRAKAHWGYDADFMRLAAGDLQISGEAIADGRVLVAVDAGNRPLGVAGWRALGEPGAFDLTHLFVEPGAMRSKVGSALFAAACDLCRAQGGRSLQIIADPNALAFYVSLGAEAIGEAPSGVIAGRALPLLRFDLTR